MSDDQVAHDTTHDINNPTSNPHNAAISNSSVENRVLGWLLQVGLFFDPFIPLDATADSHLSHYLIHHDAFTTVWGEWPSLIFAPPGGGKSALRVRATEACYVGQETNRPFPIPYVLPLLAWGSRPPKLDDHLAAMARAGAIQLLLSLAYRPHWLFRLDDAGRQAVRKVLDWNLPGPLRGYLALCRQSLSLAPLRERFNPAFDIADPPDHPTLIQFCNTLDAIPTGAQARPLPTERWEAFVHLILDILNFNSIFLLVDGLDAAPETIADHTRAIKILAPLLDVFAHGAEQGIFFKGFLSSEVQELIRSQFPWLLSEAHVTTIRWTPELLIELIRQRIQFASHGAFHSLDAIASPALREIEHALATTVLPLPREMLVLTHRVLVEHVNRRGIAGKIETEDLDAAIIWYKDNSPAIQNELPL